MTGAGAAATKLTSIAWTARVSFIVPFASRWYTVFRQEIETASSRRTYLYTQDLDCHDMPEDSSTTKIGRIRVKYGL